MIDPERLGPMLRTGGPGMLAGVRVIELADERAEYTGLLLAGLGAEVIKIEPPAGNATRTIGPFLDDQPHPERSLHFWHYNRNKKSVVIDFDNPSDQQALLHLLSGSDVFLCGADEYIERMAELESVRLAERCPELVIARVTPFGDDGPWKHYRGSDLIHLALGGIMMNCGYDPNPLGEYDLAPVAPQVWHAYHIAGEQLAIGIVAALLYRMGTGRGQDVSVAIHEAVSKNTELDVMHWVMRRVPLFRLTHRHAAEALDHSPTIASTKDGRWYMTQSLGSRDLDSLVPMLEEYGMRADLAPAQANVTRARNVPGSQPAGEAKAHTLDVIQRFVRTWRYDNMPWLRAQRAGLLWAPVRKPHENAVDAHWLTRESFMEIEHPELHRRFLYPTSKWLSSSTSWQKGRRAPRLGEDTSAVLSAAPRQLPKPTPLGKDRGVTYSARHGKPFPLQGVRVLDFGWFLASAGGSRILAALGAECYKVEWRDNPDTRLAAMAPIGGRAARQAATGPLDGVNDPDMGGQFNNKNAGKRGISLNIRHPKGLKIAKDLVRNCDIVAEGFSPGVLERLGLGYDVMKSIRPDIIYIQQSGMGAHGTYGRMRTIGPVAAALAGQGEMSGLPEPAMPAGWGYSYLDWIGAYGYALALLGALHHRNRTGEGQWIDSSQCEAGLFLTGTTILDWSANGRPWRRYGNRSPYKPAAPHGAYRCRGADRWIAIACFDDSHWRGLVTVAGSAAWTADPRFATLAVRRDHEDALDAAVEAWTSQQDAFDLMERLQAAGVPAGVCQTAEDRCDRDPQLRHLEWLTEVTGSKIGTWPVYELPIKFSETPAYSGGPVDRGAPCYGEDNTWLLSEVLGLTSVDIQALSEEGVI